MGYRMMGRTHAAILGLAAGAGREEGQGTVEYVGLILLMAAVVAGVIKVGGGHAGDIGTTVVNQLKDAIDGVGAKGAKG